MKVMKGCVAVFRPEARGTVRIVYECPIFNDEGALRAYMLDKHPEMTEGLHRCELNAWWVSDMYTRVIGEYD